MEKVINAFATHWDKFSVHEVLGGYCLEVSKYDGTRLESEVAETLEELLTEMIPLICYGRSVSMYEKMSGYLFIAFRKAKGLTVVQKGVAVRLGHPYYHYISGRYAFQAKPSDSKEIPLMNSQAIAKQLTAMLLAA
jgi:hypothetical protein